MSRIRSIHPGLWTDEAFVTLSPFARLLFMGIWNECDDAGSFAWSPLGLKMKILPADNADAAVLLEEMIGAGIVMRYEVGGKSFGAVRNFCQFQRPKKPNAVHPQTDEVRAWVNTDARSTRDGSEPMGKQLPTDGEKSRQMEDGGDKGKGSEDKSSGASPPPDLKKQVFDLGLSLVMQSGKTEGEARQMVGLWRKSKTDAEVLTGFLDCQAQAISDPLPWLQARFNGAKWVSASGYEYRGSDLDVMREAERRNDMSTYWSVKAKLDGKPKPSAKPRERRGGVSSIGDLTRQATGASR